MTLMLLLLKILLLWISHNQNLDYKTCYKNHVKKLFVNIQKIKIILNLLHNQIKKEDKKTYLI